MQTANAFSANKLTLLFCHLLQPASIFNIKKFKRKYAMHLFAVGFGQRTKNIKPNGFCLICANRKS